MIRRLMMLASVGIAVAAVVAMAWGATHSRPVLALTNCDTSTAGLDAGEQALLGMINDARAAKGFLPLKVSPSLSQAAAWKSEDSSASGSGFSHTDSWGRSPSTRAQQCGYPSGAAENLAWGFGSASTVFQAWTTSTLGHACPIDGRQVAGSPTCNPQTPAYYTVAGIGYNPQKSAWTLMLGVQDDSGDTSNPNTSSGSGSGPATPTPFPPTSTPIPRFSTPTQAAQPTATPTQFVPAPGDSYKYPTFVPIRRASIPMIAAE